MFEQEEKLTSEWFKYLRDKICQSFEAIESDYSKHKDLPTTPTFERKHWTRTGGGGGQMSIMRGNVFEKVGVNISTVYGEFSETFRKEIPGAQDNPKFFATGVSLVAHMKSPIVPSVHMNTRFIHTTKSWFGGGMDLTPTIEFAEDNEFFHQTIKKTCDKYNLEYYPKFKKECDEYFFLPHRNESRGIGGIFYDYLNTGHFDQDFQYTKDVGLTFLEAFVPLVKKHFLKEWSEEQKQQQLIKRSKYAEFNLLYDRGTKFGLMTGGNTEAILMSLPPVATWI